MGMDTQMDNRTDETVQIPADELKACCAALYASDLARLLLGYSFHPGGLALTERLGKLLNLEPGKRVLDVPAGRGTSALFLPQAFCFAAFGADYRTDSAREATRAAAA